MCSCPATHATSDSYLRRPTCQLVLLSVHFPNWFVSARLPPPFSSSLPHYPSEIVPPRVIHSRTARQADRVINEAAPSITGKANRCKHGQRPNQQTITNTFIILLTKKREREEKQEQKRAIEISHQTYLRKWKWLFMWQIKQSIIIKQRKVLHKYIR